MFEQIEEYFQKMVNKIFAKAVFINYNDRKIFAKYINLDAKPSNNENLLFSKVFSYCLNFLTQDFF